MPVLSTSPLSLVSAGALIPPDIDSEKKTPWPLDTQLIVPSLEPSTALIHEYALGVVAQSYLNIVKLPYYVKERANAADISPNGKLPVLQCGSNLVSELEGIVELAKAKGTSVSAHLSPTLQADLRAYTSLVHNVFGNALTHFTWVDNETYKTFTRKRVGSAFNFPLKMLVPWVTRQRMWTQLKILNWGEQRKSEDVYGEVETCLLALSQRLGEGDYFFGSPTELDASVFGFLHAIMTIPLPNNQLGNMVRLQSNLVHFYEHFEKLFFRRQGRRRAF